MLFCHHVVRLCIKKPVIASIEETISFINEHHCSVARYGDGEIKLCNNIDLGFQTADSKLCSTLRMVLANDIDGLIVCVPGIFGSLDCYMKHDRNHWT